MLHWGLAVPLLPIIFCIQALSMYINYYVVMHYKAWNQNYNWHSSDPRGHAGTFPSQVGNVNVQINFNVQDNQKSPFYSGKALKHQQKASAALYWQIYPLEERRCMKNSSTFIYKNIIRNYIVTPLQNIFFTRYAEIDLIAKPLLGYNLSVTMSLIRRITNLNWIWENASFSRKNYSATKRILRKTSYFPT